MLLSFISDKVPAKVIGLL